MQDILSPVDDAQLIANGYSPIACQGKAAVAQGWQSGPMTIERLAAMRELHPQARNTGLRCDDLVVLDIDVRNTDHVSQLEALAYELLGSTSLRRVGSKGCALIYKAAVPSRKMAVVTEAEVKGQFADKIEVLGIGLQFVAFGIHPDTGKPWEWTGKDDFDETATPLNVPAGTLPVVQPDQLHLFLQRASALLQTLGYSAVSIRRADEHAKVERAPDAREDDPLNISRASEHLRNCVEQGKVAVLGALGNDTIYELAALLMDRYYLSEDMTAKLMLDIWYPHCHPNHLTDDVLSIVSHAASYIQNEPGARALPPAAETFKAALNKLDLEPVGEPGEVVDKGAPVAITMSGADYDNGIMPVCATDLLAEPYPDLRELVPIWIERNVNTILEGPSATHKSRDLLQDAICIQAGLPVKGQQVERSEVFYLNYENSPAAMKRRMADIRKCPTLCPDNQTALVDTDGLHIWDLKGKNRQHIMMADRNGITLTRFGVRFRNLLRERGKRGIHTLIIFDGLMDAILFRDNTRNDELTASDILIILDLWCEEFDCTMQSILHPSRGAERGDFKGSYAASWTTKPRCLQSYKRVLAPNAPLSSGGTGKQKGLPVADTPQEHIWFQRRVDKRSEGIEGVRVWLEYWKGGLRPNPPKEKPRATQEASPSEETIDDEIPF